MLVVVGRMQERVVKGLRESEGSLRREEDELCREMRSQRNLEGFFP